MQESATRLCMTCSPVNEGPMIFFQPVGEDQRGVEKVIKLQLLAEPFDDIRDLGPFLLQQKVHELYMI